MCLAIPGQIVEIVDPSIQIAKAEVSGVRRNIHYGLVEEDGKNLAVGDWVLIHVGFAMSRIDEAEAHSTLLVLEEIGDAYQQELHELAASQIE